MLPALEPQPPNNKPFALYFWKLSSRQLTHKLCFLLLFLDSLSLQVKIVPTFFPLGSFYDTKPRHLLFDFAFSSTMAKKSQPSFLNSAQKYYIEQFTTF